MFSDNMEPKAKICVDCQKGFVDEFGVNRCNACDRKRDNLPDSAFEWEISGRKKRSDAGKKRTKKDNLILLVDELEEIESLAVNYPKLEELWNLLTRMESE